MTKKHSKLLRTMVAQFLKGHGTLKKKEKMSFTKTVCFSVQPDLKFHFNIYMNRLTIFLNQNVIRFNQTFVEYVKIP